MYRPFFQKVLLFFSSNKSDKREHFLISLVVEESSFFWYSLRATSSITGWARIMFSSLYIKMYKCLSNNINGGRKKERKIRLRSVIYLDRASDALQNRLIICFSSYVFIVKNCIFLAPIMTKLTFFCNKFFITQWQYELESWNFV